MITEFFTHISIVILPLVLYQMWAVRQSFDRLPYATTFVGLYGGLSAILSEMFPIHILGLAYDLKVIPLTLSFLYGKRFAGVLSLALVVIYRYHAGNTGAILAIAAMLAYSVPPFILSKRFDSYRPVKRMILSTCLSLIGTLIQLMFIYIYVVMMYPGHRQEALSPYLHSIFLGAAIQALLMVPTVMVIDNIVETGKVRLQLIRSQQSVKEREEQYRSLVENNPDGVCWVNEQGIITFVNKAYEHMTGYTAEELIGSHRSNLWFMEDEDIANTIMRRVFRGETLRQVDIDLRNKDGERIPLNLNAIPLTVSGEVVGYCAISTDLRPFKKAEEAIRKADKLATVGELAAGIAHEIRNPLTSLKGFLKLLRSSQDPTANRYLMIMESEMDRLNLVSNQLLTLSKPQMENKKICNLRILLQEINELMQPQALLTGVKLNVARASDNMHIWADANQVKQVLINIIKNAIEATPSGGGITVSVKDLGGDNWRLQIQDTGIGIKEDVLKRIGEPFYSTKTKGTGLGLMVSHRIVADHGGHIEYESREHKGTTVTVFLPKYKHYGQNMTESALVLINE